MSRFQTALRLMGALLLTLVTTSALAKPDKKSGGVVVKDGNSEVNIGEGGIDVIDNEAKAAAQIGEKTIVTEGGAGTTKLSGKSMTISGAGRKVVHVCGTEGVTQLVVSGSGHNITLKGDCESITLSGASHQVSVEGIGAITVSGTNNAITWLRGPDAKKAPKIARSGLNNTVTKLEAK